MASIHKENDLVALTAYVGDAKTLLAFDLMTEDARKGLAGFSIEVHPPGGADSYYVDNNLRLAPSPDHAQIAGESPVFQRECTHPQIPLGPCSRTGAPGWHSPPSAPTPTW